jgi:hypothetical protein
MNKVISFLTAASVSCGVGCHTAPYWQPRTAAVEYPAPVPNVAQAHQASLDDALDHSLRDQDEIASLEDELSLPLPNCLDAQVQCDIICEEYGQLVPQCIGYCSRAGLQCQMDRITFH